MGWSEPKITLSVGVISFQVDDGTSTGNDSRNVSVTAQNDVPVISGLDGDALNHDAGTGADVIEQGSDVTVGDLDSANFDGGNLTVNIVSGGDAAEDVLSIRNQGMGGGQIGFSGGNVFFGGVQIGTATGGASGTPLVISLNTSASTIATTALVRNITFENTDGATPTTGARTVRFTLNDGDGGTSLASDATVNVQTTNNPPVADAGGPYVINEGSSLLLNASASSDPDFDGLTYAWDLDGDGAYDDATGVTPTVTWAALGLMTNPISDDGVYTVSVQVDDGRGGVVTDSVGLTVNNVVPTITSSAAASVDENTTAVLTITTSEPVDAVTFLITGGDDQAFFNLNPTSGALTFSPTVSYEAFADNDGDNVFEVQVSTSDGDGGFDAQTILVTLDDVNEAPTAITLSNNTVNENAVAAVIGTVAAVDPDLVDSHTFSVDDARFEVVSGQLRLRAGQSINHEVEDTVTVTITATDQSGGGLTFNDSFVISVTDVNEAPTDITLSGLTVAENNIAAVIGTLGVSDVDDGDTHTWSVDDARFEIVGGQLRLRAGQSIDHETEPTVNLTISAIDQGGAGLTYNEPFVITATDVDENPVASADSFTVNSGETLVVTASGVLADDNDPEGAGLTASLDVGPSNGVLILNADGSFTYTPNPGFTGTDSFTYRASDGGLVSASTLVTLNVKAAVAPLLPSTPDDGGGDDDAESDPPPPSPEDEPESEEEETSESEAEPTAADPLAPKPARAPRENGTTLVGVVPKELADDFAWVASRLSIDSAEATGEEGDHNDRNRVSGSHDSSDRRSRLSNSPYRIAPDDLQWQSLDLFREDLLGEHKFESLVVGAAVGFSVAMSVGQAVWAVRAGYMTSTLLSTMPVWRTVDPLPVLEYLDNGDDRGDGETLESMIENASH